MYVCIIKINPDRKLVLDRAICEEDKNKGALICGKLSGKDVPPNFFALFLN